MPTKKLSAKTYLSKEEHEYFVNHASRAGVSVSEFIKRVCLGQSLQTKEDARHTLELIKLHADMGRLGGLLKLAITQETALTDEIRPLLNDLLKVKDELKQKIMDM